MQLHTLWKSDVVSDLITKSLSKQILFTNCIDCVYKMMPYTISMTYVED